MRVFNASTECASEKYGVQHVTSSFLNSRGAFVRSQVYSHWTIFLFTLYTKQTFECRVECASEHFRVTTYEGFSISLAILILGHCKSWFYHRYCDVLHHRTKCHQLSKNYLHRHWKKLWLLGRGVGKTDQFFSWFLICFSFFAVNLLKGGDNF